MVKKYKHSDDVSYTLGMTITMEALIRKPNLVKCVYLSSDIKENENVQKLKDLCRKNNIETIVNDKAFNILSQKGNVFVIGVFKKFECELNSEPHIVLVNPSDAGNLGNIIRTATGLGYENVAVIRPGVDVFDPKTIRASMGALFNINFKYYETIEDYIKEFPKHKLYSFMLEASNELNNQNFKPPFSLVFGNEASGLPDEYAEFTSPTIIPQTDKVDSLNLTIATAIAMYVAKHNPKG